MKVPSEILLFGMANSGKSTIFNGLTGGDAKVGNWHGVTSSILAGHAKILDQKIVVKDLPGVYSLTPVTLEEECAVNAVLNTKGVILCVIEAITFSLAISLVFELIKKGKQVIIAINMLKELERRGGKIDVDGLKKELAVPIICGEFNTKKDLKRLKNLISNYSSKNLNNIDYSNVILSASLAKKFFTSPKYKEQFLDKIALGKFTKIPFLFLVFFITFYLAFGKYGIGMILSNALTNLIGVKLKNFVSAGLISLNVTPFIRGLVTDGIIDGLGGIAVFLPQTLILMTALTFLELSGYMARLAFLSDRLFLNTGLNGRAIFSCLMGLGCTAVSIAASGGLENKNVRKKAVLVSGNIPCNAKIPAFALISASAVINNRFLFLAGIYFFGFISVILQIKIADKLILKSQRVPLIMEIPPYRVPRLLEVLKSLKKSFKQFIIKIITVIFIISCTLYLLKSLSPTLNYVNSGYDGSILYYIGNLFKWVFYPIGIFDAKMGIAIISGFFAKEGVASTLISLYPNGLNFSLASIISITAFFYLYTPCITAMATVWQEMGKKFTLFFGVLQLVEALISCYAVYYFITFYKIALLIIVFSGIIFILYEKLYGRKKRKIR